MEHFIQNFSVVDHTVTYKFIKYIITGFSNKHFKFEFVQNQVN